MPLPPFIEQHGNPQIPPDYRFSQVRVRSFSIEANLETLNTFCTQHLNFGLSISDALTQHQVAYHPIFPMVNLEVLSYPEMYSDYSGNSEFEIKGFMKQQELYFRIWVVKWERSGPISWPTEIAMFVPYIFVDNPWSLITGREVAGYPKAMADFSGIEMDGETSPIVMRTDVFKNYDPPEAMSLNQEAVKIEFPVAGEELLEGIWPWGSIRLEDTSSLSAPLFALFWIFLGSLSIPTIQRKQIRDAPTANIACHQALVGGELTVEDAQLHLLPPATITINRYDSLRIAEDLGLGPNPLTSFIQYTMVSNTLLLHNFINVLNRTEPAP